MIWARIQDALAIWDRSPQPAPLWHWLRLKASLCIALGWENHDPIGSYGSHCPVWASRPWTTHSADGPGQSWREIAVAFSWREWTFTEYSNGF